MIVRLTTRQFNALCRALEEHAPEPLWSYFLNREKVSEGKMHEVSMIPDAWVDVKEVLLKIYERRQSKPALLGATTRVARSCIHHVNHPAFAGLSLAEAQFEVLPGWQEYEGRPIYPLVPGPERTNSTRWTEADLRRWHVDLIPEYHQEGQLWVTTWKAYRSNDITEWLEYDELVRRK